MKDMKKNSLNNRFYYDDYLGTYSYILSEIVADEYMNKYINESFVKVKDGKILFRENEIVSEYRNNLINELAKDAKFGYFEKLFYIDHADKKTIYVRPDFFEKVKLIFGDDESRKEFITDFLKGRPIHHESITQKQLSELIDNIGEDLAKKMLNTSPNLIAMKDANVHTHSFLGHNGNTKNIKFSNIEDGIEDIKNGIIDKNIDVRKNVDIISDNVIGSINYTVAYAVIDLFANSGEEFTKIDKSKSVVTNGVKGFAIFQGSEIIEDELIKNFDYEFIDNVIEDSIGNILVAKGVVEGLAGVFNGNMEQAEISVVKNCKGAALRYGIDTFFEGTLNALGITSLDPTYITTAVLLSINVGKIVDNKLTAEKIEKITEEFFYTNAINIIN